MMRSVSFVDRLELEFTGNHFSHALVLGDVDSDGLNEVVLGSVDGVLAVFKGGHSNKPWRKCSGLGTITCVGVGDLYNRGKNVLICISAEGVCHLFTVEPDSPQPSSKNTSPSMQHKLSTKSMKSVHSQQLQEPNAKVMIIANIGGYNELFVGHTDRGVSVYRWMEGDNSLHLLQTWSLSGQIGSLSVTMTTSGMLQLLVSQPGGTYIPICYSEDSARSPHPSAKRKPKSSSTSLSQLLLVGQAQRRNPTASTEVVGHIISQSDCSIEGDGAKKSAKHSNIVALCTLDGSIRMLRDEKKQWELQVDHSLFAIEKLDVTGNGEDEIVVCAWDGMTYIVDQKRDIVRYQFEENVSAFCAGHYGMDDGKSNPCLIYTTFSNRMYIYHNVTLPSIPSSNLLLHMAIQELPEDQKQMLQSLDESQQKTLFHKCLYRHQKM